jgi:parallel beta-helix repeat protein
MEDFQASYYGVAAGTDKACIFVTDENNTWSNQLSVFSRVHVYGGYCGIWFYRASSYTVEKCVIASYTNTGIKVENAHNNDAGGTSIINNELVGTAGAMADIALYSNGGYRINGNALVGNSNYGIYLDRTGIGNTGVCIINNNSIENQQVAGIILKRSSGSLTFGSVTITGNELTSSHFSGIVQENTGWLNKVVITGNTIYVGNGYYGITMDGVTNGIISGNSLYAPSAGTAGINLTNNCTNVDIGTNNYFGFNTNVIDNSV